MSEPECLGKPTYNLSHRWGPRIYTSQRTEPNGTIWKAYEQTCRVCGILTSGEISPNLLAGVFSIEVPKESE